MKKLIKMAFILSQLMSGSAFAIGTNEAFRIVPDGAALCEGVQAKKVTDTNSNRLFFKIITGATSIEVYRDAKLSDLIFSIPTTVKATNKANLYIVNGVYWQDTSNYLVINGLYRLNSAKTKINSFVFEYIRAGGYDDGEGYTEYGPYKNTGCTESGYLYSKTFVRPAS